MIIQRSVRGSYAIWKHVRSGVKNYVSRSSTITVSSYAITIIMEVLSPLGSIQSIPSIPDDLKEVYRTVWEIDPSRIIDLAADRAPFIDQTQSMSLNLARPTADDVVRFARIFVQSCF